MAIDTDLRCVKESRRYHFDSSFHFAKTYVTDALFWCAIRRLEKAGFNLDVCTNPAVLELHPSSPVSQEHAPRDYSVNVQAVQEAPQLDSKVSNISYDPDQTFFCSCCCSLLPLLLGNPSPRPIVMVLFAVDRRGSAPVVIRSMGVNGCALHAEDSKSK